MNQSEKILQMLEDAGSQGVTNYQLNGVAFRYSARLKELRDDGYVIKARHDKGSQWTFVLVKPAVQLELLEV